MSIKRLPVHCSLFDVAINKAPFTRYNLLSNRLSNRFDNRVNVCIHDTTGCQTRCQTGCQTGLTAGLTIGWMFVYTIQPVVKPVVQPDWQPAVSCKRGIKLPAVYTACRVFTDHLSGPDTAVCVRVCVQW